MTPSRTFRDRAGKVWDVWQVFPSSTERRVAQRRVNDDERSDALERRSGLERRLGAGFRSPIAEEFTFGWLCFETADEKRRLAPVPEGWERADEDTIEQWCCVAKPVVRRKPKTERGDGGAQAVR